MAISFNEIGKGAAEKLIEQGEAAEKKRQNCQNKVNSSKDKVSKAKKEYDAACRAAANGKSSENAAKAKAHSLREAEARLAAEERALAEANAQVEQIRRQKKAQIEKIERHNRAEKSNLKTLNRIRNDAYGENAEPLMDGVVRRMNEAEEAKDALLRSLGMDAAADRVVTGRRVGVDPGWRGAGIGLRELGGDDEPNRSGAPAGGLADRQELGNRDIERRLKDYRSRITAMGIPDNAELDRLIAILRDHYAEELKKELAGKPNQLNEEPNFDSIRKLGVPFVLGMHDTLQGCGHDNVRKLYMKYANKLSVSDANYKRGAFYRSGDGVYFDKDSTAKGNSTMFRPYEVAFHEFGHNLDYVLGKGTDISVSWGDGALGKAIEADYKKLKGDRTAEQLVEDLKREIVRNNWTLHQVGSLSDVIESMTRIDYPLGAGHGSRVVTKTKPDGTVVKKRVSYWDCVPPCVEFFAEVLDGAASNEESYRVLQHFFPNAVAVVEKIIGGCVS